MRELYDINAKAYFPIEFSIPLNSSVTFLSSCFNGLSSKFTNTKSNEITSRQKVDSHRAVMQKFRKELPKILNAGQGPLKIQ